MSTSGDTAKTALRRAYRRRRQELMPELEAAILAQVRLALPQLLSARVDAAAEPCPPYLGISWPLPGEVDLRGLEGAKLALPAIVAGPGQVPFMAYRAWCPGAPLAADQCGIKAPVGPDLAPASLACLLVPALALDRGGTRLGYGGGWFDRLRAAPHWRAIPAYVVLPSGCLAPPLPRDPWDIPFPGWLDEAGFHQCPHP